MTSIIKNNKTLKLLEALGINIDEIPKKYRNSAYEINTGAGITSTLEIGFILSENTEDIKELSRKYTAQKIVTSKTHLHALSNYRNEKHVGFTHINPFWEDNVFFCLYALPSAFANELRRAHRR